MTVSNLCFVSSVNAGDHPGTLCDVPMKRPQYMWISRLITMTYLRAILFRWEWHAAKPRTAKLNFISWAVVASWFQCPGYRDGTFEPGFVWQQYDSKWRGKVSFQFFSRAGFGDGSFLIFVGSLHEPTSVRSAFRNQIRNHSAEQVLARASSLDDRRFFLSRSFLFEVIICQNSH